MNSYNDFDMVMSMVYSFSIMCFIVFVSCVLLYADYHYDQWKKGFMIPIIIVTLCFSLYFSIKLFETYGFLTLVSISLVFATQLSMFLSVKYHYFKYYYGKELDLLDYADKEHCIDLVQWKSHEPIADYIKRVVDLGRPSITSAEYNLLKTEWDQYQKSIHESAVHEACQAVYLEPLMQNSLK